MTTVIYEDKLSLQRLRHLRRRWLGVTAVWLGVVLLSFAGLRLVWPDYAWRWLGVTAVPLAYCLWVTWRCLPQNRRRDQSRLLPTFGWGNALTLMRGLAISMVAGFLFSPWPAGWLGWLPVCLYTVADVADYLDGTVARVTNHVTRLGSRLDMEFDGLGMLVVSLLAVWYGQLPWWYLSLGLARYLFLFGLWQRRRRGLPVHEIPASVHRRVFAGFQMGFMSAVLWPIMPPAQATIAGTIFALPTALGFLRDWLVASGRLNPASTHYKAVQRWLFRLSSIWLPPVLRVVVLVSMGVVVTAVPHTWPRQPWVDLFTSWQLPWPVLLAKVAIVVTIVATLAETAGVMGRTFALVLVFPIGFDLVTRGLFWENGIALAGVICLMLLGTGPLSIWRPEERYLMRRVGEDEGVQGCRGEGVTR